MTGNGQVIAVCSVGSLGKYLCDELLADGQYNDYSTESVLHILNDINASILISFNNSPGETFVTIHSALLEACRRSKNCTRFIPSEFAGNIDDFPLLPRDYQTSRVPFREILEKEKEIEWTIFNNCWLMEYFLPEDQTYMPSIPEFPIDRKNWKACIRGTGDQSQTFTSARDVAKALVTLFRAPEWEHTTYIAGQWSSFNEMVTLMENFHGRPMEKTFRSQEQIEHDLNLPPTAENKEAHEIAGIEIMMITGSGACPREKTLRQREKYFKDIKFTTVEELLLQTVSAGRLEKGSDKSH
ncbi:MAG: hypothetical protein Q9182_002792 [Xanthomendoza sp. 2 TL-2023]